MRRPKFLGGSGEETVEETTEETLANRQFSEEQKLSETIETKKNLDAIIAKNEVIISDGEKAIVTLQEETKTFKARRDNAFEEANAAELDKDEILKEKSKAEKELADFLVDADTKKELSRSQHNDVVTSLKVKIGSFEADLVILEQRLKDSLKKVSEADERIVNLQAQEQKISEQIETKKKELLDIDSDIESRNKVLENLKEKQDELGTVSKKVVFENGKLTKIEGDIRDSQEELNTLNDKKIKVNEEINEKIRIGNLTEQSINYRMEKLNQLIDKATVAGIIKDNIV